MESNEAANDKDAINLKEIVRREVMTALKTLLAQSIKEETERAINSVVKSGDYHVEVSKSNHNNTSITPNTIDSLPVKVVKPDGTIEHRRRKRTQAEMKDAIAKALPLVAKRHPDWSDKRIRRLAKNLVRRYKVIA